MILHPAYIAAFQRSEGAALGALRRFRGGRRSVWNPRQLRQLLELADSSINHAVFAVSICNTLSHFFEEAINVLYLGNMLAVGNTLAEELNVKVCDVRHGDVGNMEESESSHRSKS